MENYTIEQNEINPAPSIIIDESLNEEKKQVTVDEESICSLLREYGISEEDISKLKIHVSDKTKFPGFANFNLLNNTITLYPNRIFAKTNRMRAALRDFDPVESVFGEDEAAKIAVESLDPEERTTEVQKYREKKVKELNKNSPNGLITTKRIPDYLLNEEIPIERKIRFVEKIIDNAEARMINKTLLHELAHYVQLKGDPNKYGRYDFMHIFKASLVTFVPTALILREIATLPDSASKNMLIIAVNAAALYTWFQLAYTEHPREKGASKFVSEHTGKNLVELIHLEAK